MDISSSLIIIISVAVVSVVNGVIMAINNKAIEKRVEEKSKSEKQYERRFKIYKGLFESAAQVINDGNINLKLVDFVNAFNLSLVEFRYDKEIVKIRKDFLDTVTIGGENNKEVDVIKRNKTMISLINAIGKKIDINNISESDICNYTYWPIGFNTIMEQKRDLVRLQIKLLEKINNDEISINVGNNKTEQR